MDLNTANDALKELREMVASLEKSLNTKTSNEAKEAILMARNMLRTAVPKG